MCRDSLQQLRQLVISCIRSTRNVKRKVIIQMPSPAEPALLTNNPMVENFYDNTQSNVIRITDDKLKVILLENKEGLRKQNDFIAPLTLLISLILTFCTTDFRDFLTVAAPVWKAFYFFLTIASFIWLFIELQRKRKTVTIDQLIEQIRRQKQSPALMQPASQTLDTPGGNI